MNAAIYLISNNHKVCLRKNPPKPKSRRKQWGKKRGKHLEIGSINPPKRQLPTK